MTIKKTDTQELESPLMALELQRTLDSVEYLLKTLKDSDVTAFVNRLHQICQRYDDIPLRPNTAYANSIPLEQQPEYPGDLAIESRLTNIHRWNAMAMVVKANRNNDGIGGHISTYASCADLYEVGFNHFFKGNGEGFCADQVYFQGHASPGNYARSYFEGRLSPLKLHHFRQELAEGGGLSSYPHPYLMPDYWQFPTVSMGLGPITAIYQARFNRYLQHRGVIDRDPNVWAFLGDGESDEPETLGALTLASREKLDNLIFVVNCNLQRLDGPVRGNGKIIQELEAVFMGAGWHVIKVIWGSNWDSLLSSKSAPLLLRRMAEVVDGDYQKYVVEPGSYMRKHFFGKYPELLQLVSHLSDDEIKQLARGGHDPKKIYAAYKEAVEYKGKPVVVLAKSVKGYGLGEAGEGKNISHNQKKMNEKELRVYLERLGIPISDEDVVNAPFYRPVNSKEFQYCMAQRKALGGFLPERKESHQTLAIPDLDYFSDLLVDSGSSSLSTTTAFVRVLTKLLRHKEIGKFVVPIIPDEARTFGMESLFRQVGIYSSKGQLYEPVDSHSLLYYREEKDGQVLEEGINEAGSMASFIAAGTSYVTHGQPMLPFYIYYSMFGFQRIGDLAWLAGDMRCKGFLVGGTAGRTTLNGEGLQHQDGHSHLLASTVPSLITYDPAFLYELTVIVQHGLKRMYQNNEHVFYYLTVGNENRHMPAMPKGVDEGIVKGLYKYQASSQKKSLKAHIFASGMMMLAAVKACDYIQTNYDISVDIWSATSYNCLRREAIDCQRYNMLHPENKPRLSYLETLLSSEEGIFVAVSDYMRLVSDQITSWVPGGLFSLGTDGFGRSDSRDALRDFFEVDDRYIVVAVLYQLASKNQLEMTVVQEAIQTLKVDPEKVYPVCSK
ncbi:MAG: pyruvate dehydrogenase (acetyl-transferring), homodimeric type [bacterium]